jgi:hypothetical protein
MKAHVDLRTPTSTGDSEHKKYGKSTFGIFRSDVAPTPNSPAAEIENELKDLWEGN